MTLGQRMCMCQRSCLATKGRRNDNSVPWCRWMCSCMRTMGRSL